MDAMRSAVGSSSSSRRLSSDRFAIATQEERSVEADHVSAGASQLRSGLSGHSSVRSRETMDLFRQLVGEKLNRRINGDGELPVMTSSQLPPLHGSFDDVGDVDGIDSGEIGVEITNGMANDVSSSSKFARPRRLPERRQVSAPPPQVRVVRPRSEIRPLDSSTSAVVPPPPVYSRGAKYLETVVANPPGGLLRPIVEVDEPASSPEQNKIKALMKRTSVVGRRGVEAETKRIPDDDDIPPPPPPLPSAHNYKRSGSRYIAAAPVDNSNRVKSAYGKRREEEGEMRRDDGIAERRPDVARTSRFPDFALPATCEQLEDRVPRRDVIADAHVQLPDEDEEEKRRRAERRKTANEAVAIMLDSLYGERAEPVSRGNGDGGAAGYFTDTNDLPLGYDRRLYEEDLTAYRSAEMVYAWQQKAFEFSPLPEDVEDGLTGDGDRVIRLEGVSEGDGRLLYDLASCRPYKLSLSNNRPGNEGTRPPGVATLSGGLPVVSIKRRRHTRDILRVLLSNRRYGQQALKVRVTGTGGGGGAAAAAADPSSISPKRRQPSRTTKTDGGGGAWCTQSETGVAGAAGDATRERQQQQQQQQQDDAYKAQHTTSYDSFFQRPENYKQGVILNEIMSHLTVDQHRACFNPFMDEESLMEQIDDEVGESESTGSVRKADEFAQRYSRKLQRFVSNIDYLLQS